MRKKIEISVPVRIHLSVFDMNKFGLGKPGGGGIGVGINQYTKVVVEKDTTEEIIRYERKVLVEHFVNIMKEKLDYKGNFCIKIEQNFESHVGFGSSSSAVMSLLLAINKLFDDKYTYNELVEFLVHNMIEEDDCGEITKCFETGVGPWTNILGGVVVVDENCSVIENMRLTDQSIILVLPNTYGKENVHSEEKELITQTCSAYEHEDFDIKQRLIVEKLLPSLNKRDSNALINSIQKLADLGSKKAEIEFQNRKHKNYIKFLNQIAENEKLPLVSMSSIGPCVVMLGEQAKIECAFNIINDSGFDLKVIRSEIDNDGYQATYID